MTSAFFSPVADHLWQSTIFVLGAALLALAVRKNQARTRHWIWMAASVKFLIPLALLINLGHRFDWLISRPVEMDSSISAFLAEQIAQPFTWSPKTAGSPEIAGTASGASGSTLPALAIALWLSGCLTLLLRWRRNWRRVRNILSQGQLLTEGREVETLQRLEQTVGISKPIAIVSSASAIEPSVFGVIQPVLLWPAGLAARLADAELEAIMVHELSHVRRRDNLTAMLHIFIEAMFWFHPLVWWIGTRLVDEREKACDEDVLRRGGVSEVYAEGILKVCEFCAKSPLLCAAGVSGSDLKRRIEDIMKNQVMPKLSFSRVVLLLVAGVFALAGPIVLGITHAKPLLMPTPLGAAVPAPIPVPPQPVEVPRQPEVVRTVPVQTPAPARETLELVTIRPSVPNPNASPGARGGLASERQRALTGGCQGGPPSIERNRAVWNNNSLYTLISWAYGMNCLQAMSTNLILGADDWAKYEQWIIDTLTPQGTVIEFGAARLQDPPVKDPRLQGMLRNFLADRFKLTLHRETRTVPAYSLVVASSGHKLRADALFTAKDVPTPAGAFDIRMGPKASMSAMTNILTTVTHRPVFDRTGITEGYPMTVFYSPSDNESLFKALEEQLGLKLEETTTSVEVLVVDHAERPIQN